MLLSHCWARSSPHSSRHASAIREVKSAVIMRERDLEPHLLDTITIARGQKLDATVCSSIDQAPSCYYYCSYLIRASRNLWKGRDFRSMSRQQQPKEISQRISSRFPTDRSLPPSRAAVRPAARQSLPRGSGTGRGVLCNSDHGRLYGGACVRAFDQEEAGAEHISSAPRAAATRTPRRVVFRLVPAPAPARPAVPCSKG
jgi:hypothetical protein